MDRARLDKLAQDLRKKTPLLGTLTRCGVEFLGWHIFPDHRRLRRTTGVRFQRRLRELMDDYRNRRIDYDDVRASVMSWIGHLKHGDTWGLRTTLLEQAVFVRPTGGGDA